LKTGNWIALHKELKLPSSHRNKTMEKEIVDYHWECDNCLEWVSLTGSWVYLAGKYICEQCYLEPLREDYIDTKHIKKHIREELLDDAECSNCHTKENLEIDHIYPRSKGGKSNRDNLQILCKSCNCKKGAKT
jgi:5-methylcytosine-specific restriction endonuclease McrA